MRKLPILLALILISIIAKPQKVELALQSGASVPVLDFASTDLTSGSFAMTGFAASAQLKSSIKGNWGVFIQAGIQLNPIEVSLLGYEKVKADPFLDDIYIRSDPFKTIEFTAGPTYKWQVLNKMTIEGKLDAGIMVASTPYQLNKPNYFIVGPSYFEITPSTDYCFTFGGGISFIYDITTCYSLAFNTQYLQAAGKFKFIQGQSLRTESKNINLWNNNLALIINLF
jgi:hypothetical protein